MTGVSGFAVGWLFCRTVWKGKSDSTRFVAEKLNRDVDEAEMRYLDGLRRDLANEIMVDDTEAMHRAFHKLLTYEKDLRKAGKERIDADFKALCLKYPAFQDFEPYGTMHFVASQDARSSLDTNDLIDRYADISQMLIINAARKGTTLEVFSEREAEQLDKAIRKRKDRAFENRLRDAMERYYALLRALRNVPGGIDVNTYDDGTVSIRSVLVEHSPEIGYGIHFADTNEYGLHTVFVDDDRDKTYRSYYRSDSKFKEQQYLDT
ncbi:hypothetical protein [Ensifer adhaerens]|uniref:hypothetical protein n=1 Tax=Ensifer adhaerens TaxID=106592 RepID=UPI00156A5352|nr:hypothetical protein [Ensifer adhaerens]